MTDLEYIKKFSKITIKKICLIEKIDSSNLYKGKISDEKIKRVRKRLESEVASLYVIEKVSEND